MPSGTRRSVTRSHEAIQRDAAWNRADSTDEPEIRLHVVNVERRLLVGMSGDQCSAHPIPGAGGSDHLQTDLRFATRCAYRPDDRGRGCTRRVCTGARPPKRASRIFPDLAGAGGAHGLGDGFHSICGHEGDHFHLPCRDNGSKARNITEIEGGGQAVCGSTFGCVEARVRHGEGHARLQQPEGAPGRRSARNDAVRRFEQQRVIGDEQVDRLGFQHIDHRLGHFMTHRDLIGRGRRITERQTAGIPIGGSAGWDDSMQGGEEFADRDWHGARSYRRGRSSPPASGCCRARV